MENRRDSIESNLGLKRFSKVIFLDFDGVIFSARTQIGLKGGGIWNSPDMAAVGLISDICHQTGAKIVVSSTWGRIYGAQAMECLLFTWNLSQHLVPTPALVTRPWKMSGTRGHEIKQWLEEHGENFGIEKYCIIDDDSDMLEAQLPYFVRTPTSDGLLWEHYKKTIEILGKTTSDPK